MRLRWGPHPGCPRAPQQRARNSGPSSRLTAAPLERLDPASCSLPRTPTRGWRPAIVAQCHAAEGERCAWCAVCPRGSALAQRKAPEPLHECATKRARAPRFAPPPVPPGQLSGACSCREKPTGSTPHCRPLPGGSRCRASAWPAAGRTAHGGHLLLVHATSKRSRFITLVHAATKSCTNFCCASALA